MTGKIQRVKVGGPDFDFAVIAPDEGLSPILLREADLPTGAKLNSSFVDIRVVFDTEFNPRGFYEARNVTYEV